MIVKRLNKLWLGYDWLTAQPQTGSEKSLISVKTKWKGVLRVGSVALYVACTILAIVLSYLAVTHLPTVTEIDKTEDYPHMMPQLILCPRPGFLLNVHEASKPPDYGTGTTDYQKKWVSRMRGPQLVYTSQVSDKYKFAVWYNTEMIRMINMSVQMVDQFTDFYVNNPPGKQPTLPERYQLFLDLAKILVNEANITEQLDSDTEEWTVPMHPNLQSIIKSSEGQKLYDSTLLWWVIIRTQYVPSYGAHDMEPPSMNDRRFHCDAVDCGGSVMESVWLDSHYCVLFNWENSNETAETGKISLRAVDSYDEVMYWVGNIYTTQIRMQDFLMRDTDKDGWFYRKDEAKSSHGMNAHYQELRLIETTPRPVECQSLLGDSANSDNITNKYCQKRELTTYSVFLINAPTVSSMYEVVSSGPVERYNQKPTYTYVQKFGIIGGLMGLCTGFSLMQIPMVMAHGMGMASKKMKPLIDYGFSIVLIAACGYMLVTDLLSILTVEQRYSSAPLVQKTSEVEIPAIWFGGNPYYSRLSFNTTKLVEYNATPEMLNYMILSAVGKTYHNHLDNGGRTLRAGWKVLPEPTPFMFSSYYPSESRLREIEQLYDAVKAKVNENKPYDVLKHFLMSPCVIIKGCQHGTERWNCCDEFEISLSSNDVAIFKLKWYNSRDKKFGNKAFRVFIDATEYDHTDINVPFLGAGVADQKKSIAKHFWLQKGRLRFGFSYKTTSVSANNLGLTRSIRAGEVSNENVLRLELSAEMKTLLPKHLKTNSKCDVDPVCRQNGDDTALARLLTVAKHCGCRLCSTPHQMRLLSFVPTLACCTDRLFMGCVANNQTRWHIEYCASKDNGDNKVWHPSIDRKKRLKSYLNLFTYGYNDYVHCDFVKLVTGESASPLANTVSVQEIEKCSKAIPCTTGSYKSTAVFTGLKNLEQKATSDYFILELAVTTDLNIGTQEIDNFSFFQMFSIVIGIIGLFLGLSILPLSSVVISSVRSLVSAGPSKNIFELMMPHWLRSLGFFQKIVSSNQVAVADKPEELDTIEPAPKNPPTAESSADSKLELNHIPEVLLLVASTLTAIFLVSKITWINGIESLLNERVTTMRLVDNGVSPTPEMAICFNEPSVAHTKVLSEVMQLSCLYNEVNLPCEKMLPVHISVNGHTCAMTIKTKKPVSSLSHNKSRIALYTIRSMVNTSFTSVWVGDLLVFRQQFSPKPLSGRMVQQLNYMAYSRTSSIECSSTALAETELRPCTPGTAHDMCFLSDSVYSTVIPLQRTDLAPCRWNTFRLKELSENAPNVNQTDDDQVFSVYNGYGNNYYEMDDGFRYNWPMAYTIIGGYVDGFVGISLLNILYCAVLYVFKFL